MASSQSAIRHKGSVLLVAALALPAIGCKTDLDAAAPQQRTIRFANPAARSGSSGDLSLVGLARRYAQQMPALKVELLTLLGAVATVSALQKGEADVGMASVDVTYLAYHGLLEGNATRFESLRGVAVLHFTTIQLLASAQSNIKSVADLGGKRVSITDGSGMSVLAKPILMSHGVDPKNVRVETLETDEAFARLREGTLDALLFRSTYPSPRITDALRRGAHLIPLVGAPIERLRHDYPFIRLAVVPAGTYPGLASPLKTIAVDTVLLCRRELDEAVVYELTRGFFAELPDLSILGSLRFLDLDQAPAVPIPLHEGAARYYREVELLQ